jgi:hypothetical protein
LRLCEKNNQRSAPWRRRVFALGFLLAAICPAWARGGVETVTAEGGETWAHTFNIGNRKKGTYNYIVNAQDQAGNPAVSGPFNIKIDPNSGIPTVRVVYPENNTIIRQDINVLGIAAGRFGIDKVSIRLDNSEPLEADGKEYWNKLVEFKNSPDGKHSMFVKANDSRGTGGPEQKIDFILDTTPPKLELISHKIGDIISSNVDIKGKASDPNGIRSLEISYDGENFRKLKYRNWSGSAYFSVPINAQKTQDGPYVYHLRAVDTTGIATVKPYLFFINKDAPTLEILTPLPGENVFDSFMLSGKAYAKVGIEKISFQWGIQKGVISIRIGDPYWCIPLKLLKNSPKTIKVTAVDKAGNSVSAVCNVQDRRAKGQAAPLPAQTNIQFIFPANKEIVHGSKTVIGYIEHPVPIKSISMTVNGINFEELQVVSRQGKAWFSYFCDFTKLAALRGRLSFRITDVNGTVFDKSPEYMLDPNPPLPTIILNSPVDDEVISNPFEISGVAFSDVGIDSIHWRFLGPKMESLSRGEAGRTAREAAQAYLDWPDVPFNQIKTESNFTVPIDFTMITDGEYICEVYVADPYGVRSETVARTIKISTAPPVTRIISPAITRYNSHVVLVKGFTADANDVDSVIVSMDSGLTWQAVVLNPAGTWDLPLNTAIYTDRIYSAYIIAKDRYGITSFSNAMINIDNTPPGMVLSSPASGQYVGENMPIIGRLADNIELKTLKFQVINVVNPNIRTSIDVPPQKVIFETFSMARFQPGEYVVRVISTDLADNETIISRKIVYDPNDIDAQVAIFSPLPGEEHSGPVYLAGLVTGTFLPETVHIILDGVEFRELPVDRFGIFRYEITEKELGSDGPHKIAAYYIAEKGRAISSASHTVYYSHYGPLLLIDSHRDGDVITERPWLKGRAMLTVPPRTDGKRYTRAEVSQYAVSKVEVSYDNGRTFKRTLGTGDWKWRLEAYDLPPGTQPVVVRATFANGETAVRRVLIYVDTDHPKVEAVSPVAKSVHRDEINIYGAASDNFKLTDVDISLRPFGKFWYEVPLPLRGMFFDVKTLGATYFDVGAGLSFFDNNVRIQGQFGISPAEGRSTAVESGGRYVGYVTGIKLLANIWTMPFDWLLKNRDWAFYKMKFAVGANFSWFQMDDWRDPLYIGAVIGQIDLANVDWRYAYPNWKYFHIMSLYLQPELWFASTDALTDGLGHDVPKTILRMSIGLRFNVF